MQKTIHRIMWEVLTPEQFKNWNRQTEPQRVGEMLRRGLREPAQIIASSFEWKQSKEGHTYWAQLAYLIKPSTCSCCTKVRASEAALVKVHTYEGTRVTHE